LQKKKSKEKSLNAGTKKKLKGQNQGVVKNMLCLNSLSVKEKKGDNNDQTLNPGEFTITALKSKWASTT